MQAAAEFEKTRSRTSWKSQRGTPIRRPTRRLERELLYSAEPQLFEIADAKRPKAVTLLTICADFQQRQGTVGYAIGALRKSLSAIEREFCSR